ncbi:unnamed protein product [Owenia fusiformis]|uniref:YqaJ viral recombinase domain-containing protein n=1 Tax=Owenia fusiformis TaxID=6347 RepID=A0A8S4Q408_OWEFU|nr:unnamed protein product [Owenia fusiformis]
MDSKADSNITKSHQSENATYLLEGCPFPENQTGCSNHIESDDQSEMNETSSNIEQDYEVTIEDVHDNEESDRDDLAGGIDFEPDDQGDGMNPISGFQGELNDIDDGPNVPNMNENEMYDEINKLLPEVIANLAREGVLTSVYKFIKLVADGEFPIENMAFLCFLDVVEWYSHDSTTRMRYKYPSTTKFWRIGWRLFKGKYMRFMAGTKNKGTGSLDPKSSKINFAVPNRDVLKDTEMEPMTPGIMDNMIKVMAQLDTGLTYKCVIDGKKIARGKGRQMGDIDLWGFESPPTLAERVAAREFLDERIQMLMNKTENLLIKGKKSTDHLLDEESKELLDHLKIVSSELNLRLKDLRQAKVAIERSLKRLKDNSGPDWRKSKYVFVISSLETSKYTINNVINQIVQRNDKLYETMSILNKNGITFSTSDYVNMNEQQNYHELREDCYLVIPDNEYTDHVLVKQRSDRWFNIRKEAKVTGSTMHNAIGLDTLKKQRAHYDKVIHGKEEDKQINEQTRRNMEYGTKNEINAVATLTSKILPVLLPDLSYAEEGCYKITMNNETFLVVSPDGKLFENPSDVTAIEESKTKVSIEIKCKPQKELMEPVAYTVYDCYIPQCLAEMNAQESDRLLFICYSEETTTCFMMKYSDSLWDLMKNECVAIYGGNQTSRPSKKTDSSKKIKEEIKIFKENNVEYMGEFKSVKAYDDHDHGSESDSTCPYKKKRKSYVPKKSTTTLEELKTNLHDVMSMVNEIYEATRQTATELLAFLLCDMDRITSSEQTNSTLVAYAMKGSSMRTNVMRDMVDSVFYKCQKQGLYMPIVTYDGQWLPLAIRTRDGRPLTLMQMQKDHYSKVRKLKANDIIKNAFKNETYIAKHLECKTYFMEAISINSYVDDNYKSKQTTISLHHMNQIIQWKKQKGTSNINKEPSVVENSESGEDTNVDDIDILEHIPDAVLQKLDDDVKNQVINLLKGKNAACSTQIELSDVLEPDESLAEAVAQIEASTVFEDKVHGESNGEARPTITLDDCDYYEMIKSLQHEDKTNKKWISENKESLQSKMETATDINKQFTLGELKSCFKAIKCVLEKGNVEHRIGCYRYKWQLVNLFSSICGNGTTLQTPSSKRGRIHQPKSLKTQCIEFFKSVPKSILCNIYAENTWPQIEHEWRSGFVINDDVKITNGLDIGRWYSQPDMAPDDSHPMFHLWDFSHLLVNLRSKICLTGLPESGINRTAWIEASRSKATKLNRATVEDCFEKQDVGFAKSMFETDVEDFLLERGFIAEAEFCNIVRGWYHAEDEPGIPAIKRVESRLKLRNWLLGLWDSTVFPPPGSHVKSFPIQMYEGFLTSIERKIQMFPFISRGSYNSRASGSLEVEQFFQTFGDLDPTGKGILKPDVIPRALATSCEIEMDRVDPARTFCMKTSARSVYPTHPLFDRDKNLSDDTIPAGWTPPAHVETIDIRDHFFDSPTRLGKNIRKRKRGIVSKPDAPARRSNPIRRDFYRGDQSKLTADKRAGILL